MFELAEWLGLGLTGLFAGLVGGMLGVGGSIVMIPAMTELMGPDQHLYQAAAMIVNFFVVVPAVVQHRRAGGIDASTVSRLVPVSIVAVVLGVGISELPVFEGSGEAYLRVLFGLFLFAAAGYDVYRLIRNRGVNHAGAPPAAAAPEAGGHFAWWRACTVALPTGLVAGLLGVGGGVLAVPLQRRLLHIPIRIAIANSATIIISTSLIGAISKNYAFAVAHGSAIRPLALAGVLAPSAILGSMCGSRLTYRLPLRMVKVGFFLLLAVAALRLICGAIGDL